MAKKEFNLYSVTGTHADLICVDCKTSNKEQLPRQNRKCTSCGGTNMVVMSLKTCVKCKQESKVVWDRRSCPICGFIHDE